jgi:hypothetical protein
MMVSGNIKDEQAVPTIANMEGICNY